VIQVHADRHCAGGTTLINERVNVLEPWVERA